jgi:hypothetical protein
LFRSLAGGKGGSLAGRVFEGTSPPPCGVLSRKSETRRAKSPLNGQDSACPGERCSCYGEYKPVWMTCPEKPSTPSFSWPAPDKGKPRQWGAERGLCSRQLMRGHGLAEASPQYVARYFVPADSTLFRRHLDKPHVACSRLHRALPPIPGRQAPVRLQLDSRDQARRLRLMARRDPVGIRLLTRNGNDWSARFPWWWRP